MKGTPEGDQRGSFRNADYTVSPVGCAKMIEKKIKMAIENPWAVINGVIVEQRSILLYYYILL